MLVFYFFALIVIWIGWISLRGGIDYLNFFKSELAKPRSDYEPFCTVIAPCRGLDKDLEENLSALFKQDFPAYDIIFVTDSPDDPCVSVINSLISTSPRIGGSNKVNSKLVIAGKAENEGQKVHNLRQAVLEASDKSEIFVFVDSDARPGVDWLRNLIAPLQDDTIGCASGYRWFISKRGNFASELLSVWNASIASALGKNTEKNFCWGGSMAMQRDTFEQIGMHEKWRGTLSDDFAVMRTMKEAGVQIAFVPQCLTATIHDNSFGEMLEFTTRQMKITRVYASNFWKASLIGSLLFSVVFWLGVLLLFFTSGIHFWLTFSFLLITLALGIGKAWLRLNAVKLILKDYEKELSRQFIWQITLWPFSPIVYLYNSISALLSRKIKWRGIEYELKSPTETVIIGGHGK